MIPPSQPPGPPWIGPSQLPAKRHFIIEIWEENREAVKALLADTFLALVAFGGLFILFLALRRMERAGYSPERIQTFETIHYWGYLIVLGLFMSDLVLKLFTFFFLKRKP
jgi:hypothetical protein